MTRVGKGSKYTSQWPQKHSGLGQVCLGACASVSVSEYLFYGCAQKNLSTDY